MVIAIFINDEGSSVFIWDSNYICEYSDEEIAAYHTIVVYNGEVDKKLYEKINGKILLDDKE